MDGKRWTPAAALVVALALGATSVYLFLREVALSATRVVGGDWCSAVFQASCDQTLLASEPIFLNLTWSAWGVVYGAVLVFLISLGMIAGPLFRQTTFAAAIVLNAGGLGVSAYLGWLIYSGAAPFCPLCVQTHLLNLALLPLLVLARGGGIRGFARDIRDAARFVFAPGGQTGPAAQARIMGLLAAALIAVIAYQWALLRVQPATAAEDAAESFGEAWAALRDQEPVAIPVGPEDPRLGLPGSPVEIVVFSDFQCPTCRTISKTLEKLVTRHSDDVSIVFKHFPLNSQCNRLAVNDLHPNACELARAGYAAHEQGRFWEFHDAVFARSSPSANSIAPSADQAGLDLNAFETVRKSEAAAEKVRADVDLGIELGITGTPAVFLNGRQVPPEHLGQVAPLVELLLELELD